MSWKNGCTVVLEKMFPAEVHTLLNTNISKSEYVFISLHQTPLKSEKHINIYIFNIRHACGARAVTQKIY